MKEQTTTKLERLRKALIEGEESGEPEPFDFDRFIEEELKAAKSKAPPPKPSS